MKLQVNYPHSIHPRRSKHLFKCYGPSWSKTIQFPHSYFSCSCSHAKPFALYSLLHRVISCCWIDFFFGKRSNYLACDSFWEGGGLSVIHKKYSETCITLTLKGPSLLSAYICNRAVPQIPNHFTETIGKN